MVEYEADFFILRPAEPRRGSGALVYDVTNRGRKVILGRLDEAGSDADTNNPKSAQDVGLAFTRARSTCKRINVPQNTKVVQSSRCSW